MWYFLSIGNTELFRPAWVELNDLLPAELYISRSIEIVASQRSTHRAYGGFAENTSVAELVVYENNLFISRISSKALSYRVRLVPKANQVVDKIRGTASSKQSQ